MVNGGELELRDAILIDQAGHGRAARALAGHDRRGRRRRDRRTGRTSNRRNASTRARSRRQPVPGGVADELGTPRGKPGRASPGRLGGRDDRRASDRAGRRSASGFHRGRGPPAQRQPAESRRPAVQPARRRRTGPSRLAISSKCKTARPPIDARPSSGTELPPSARHRRRGQAPTR